MNTVYLKLKSNNEELFENMEVTKIKSCSFYKKLKNVCITFVSFIKYLFNIITVKEICGAYIFIFPFTFKLRKRAYKLHVNKSIIKVKKLLNKYNVSRVILSDDLKNNENFINKFTNKQLIHSKIALLNGKSVMTYLIYEIIEYILKIQGRQAANTDVYLLIHENKNIYTENILFLIHRFRTINIITDNIRAFQKLADKIQQKEGINITVSNNTRKSLKKAKYIINFDFLSEELKKYSIYRTAILIHAGAGLNYDNQTFGGIQVYNMNINAKKEILDFFEKYNLLGQISLISLYEGLINDKENFYEVRRKMENDQIKIINLCGRNGIIEEKEYNST